MLVLKNAVLIDGTGAPPQRDATVILKGKQIEAVGRGLPVPDGAQVVDLEGMTLLPGFSDAHTHFGGSARLDRPGLTGRFGSYDYAEHREAALRWGVTAVRSAGDFTPEILEFRDEVNAGKIRSPRVIAAGRMVQADGGHPAFTVFFSDAAIVENACVILRADTDIEAEIAKLSDLGVDWIKIFVSDDNKMQYPCTVPRLSNEQLRRIVDAAHKHGKPVMAHVDDIGNLKDAVLLGADSVEHTINVATLRHEVTDRGSASADRPGRLGGSHDDAHESARRLHSGRAAGLSRLGNCGGQNGAGRSEVRRRLRLGNPLHPLRGMRPYGNGAACARGMEPLAAVTAATGGNAKLFRKNDVFGTWCRARRRISVVLGSSPLDDIRNTRDIRLVFRDGSVVIDRFFAQ
jgi:imidazolonepropionase-like amidohydrolase